MTLTFDAIARGCTAAERDALAWHLAMFRARKTYEALRVPTTPTKGAASDV